MSYKESSESHTTRRPEIRWLIEKYLAMEDTGRFGNRLVTVLAADLIGVVVCCGIITLVILSGLLHPSPESVVDESFFMMVYVIPALETLLCMTLPGCWGVKWGWSKKDLLMGMVMAFLLLHIVALGVLEGLIVGGVFGLILSPIYVTQMSRSHTHAILWSVFAHGLVNASAYWLTMFTEG